MKPTIDQTLTDLIDYNTMLQQLHDWCDINSGSEHLAGLALMQAQLRQAYLPLAADIESHSLPPVPFISMSGDSLMQQRGDALLIRKRPELSRRVLLSGHMDTVYSATHPFQQLRYLDDNTINGPGVADMKGGLVVMLHALLAFEQTDVAQYLGWDVLINADEELGSQASSPLLMSQAQQAQAALVYEPSLSIEGLCAKNRKGNAKLTLIANGKAAHAGRQFDDGRNAICYLAEIIGAIHALNGQRQGVTLNVGKIAGGTALNCVPDRAVAKVDIRLAEDDDDLWVRQQLDKVKQQHTKNDYQLSMDYTLSRPVKRVNAATKRLFSRVQQSARSMGLIIDWTDSGGCCDGNNLAANGLAVIDTLGVRGGSIHTDNEFIQLDSLTERAALSYLLLTDLANGGLEALSNPTTERTF